MYLTLRIAGKLRHIRKATYILRVLTAQLVMLIVSKNANEMNNTTDNEYNINDKLRCDVNIFAPLGNKT